MDRSYPRFGVTCYVLHDRGTSVQADDFNNNKRMACAHALKQFKQLFLSMFLELIISLRSLGSRDLIFEKGALLHNCA